MMKLNRKPTRQVTNPPLLSSVDISSTFEDDFLTSPVYTPLPSTSENIVSYHKDGTEIPQLRDHLSSEKVTTGFETYNSVPYSSPVTCVASTVGKCATDMWGNNDCGNDIEELGFKTDFLDDDDKISGFPSKVPQNIDDDLERRGLTEPVAQYCEMKDMKQFKSMSSIQLRQSGKSPRISSKSQPSQGWVFNGLTMRNLSRLRTRINRNPITFIENEEEYDETPLDSDHNSVVPSSTDNGHHQQAQNFEDSRKHWMNNSQIRMDSTTGNGANEVKHNGLGIEQGRDGPGSSEEQNLVQNSSQVIRAKSLLGRLSQHRSASSRSKNRKGFKKDQENEEIEPSSTPSRRNKSGFLFKVWTSLLDRGPNGEIKAGVFDFDCDPQTALQEMKTTLERNHLGFHVSDRVNEVRIKIPLKVAGKHSLINLTVSVDSLSEGKSRVCLRRGGIPDMLTVRHEDFDWFCFQVYRTLLRRRKVVRPFV